MRGGEYNRQHGSMAPPCGEKTKWQRIFGTEKYFFVLFSQPPSAAWSYTPTKVLFILSWKNIITKYLWLSYLNQALSRRTGREAEAG